MPADSSVRSRAAVVMAAPSIISSAGLISVAVRWTSQAAISGVAPPVTARQTLYPSATAVHRTRLGAISTSNAGVTPMYGPMINTMQSCPSSASAGLSMTQNSGSASTKPSTAEPASAVCARSGRTANPPQA